MDMIIICDLDGTLCNCDHRLQYAEKKEWYTFNALCVDDTINEDVANIIRNLKSDDTKIYIVTGRDEIFRDQTIDWLQLNDVSYDELFMRPENDHRPDHVIKQEILNEKIDESKVWFVLDDRKSVVDMWRSNGLRCLQVQEGDF